MLAINLTCLGQPRVSGIYNVITLKPSSDELAEFWSATSMHAPLMRQWGTLEQVQMRLASVSPQAAPAVLVPTFPTCTSCLTCRKAHPAIPHPVLVTREWRASPFLLRYPGGLRRVSIQLRAAFARSWFPDIFFILPCSGLEAVAMPSLFFFVFGASGGSRADTLNPV